MKTLLAVALFLGSTVGAMAVESYGDYRDYFDAKLVTVKRAPSVGSKKKAPIDIATDLSAVRRPANGNRSEMYRYFQATTGTDPFASRGSDPHAGFLA